jgi:hypothetical protein
MVASRKDQILDLQYIFAVLVNPLMRDWQGRIKFVDDATAILIACRCRYYSLLTTVFSDSDIICNLCDCIRLYTVYVSLAHS